MADLSLARKVLETEAAAILALVERIDGGFSDAVHLVRECRGRVILTGMGKSGIICRKIAATLSSTGTPAFFLHPAEAVHGDLGVIQTDDVVIAMSYSGETEELTLPFALKVVGNEPFLYSSDFPHEVTNQSCKHDIEELLESEDLTRDDKEAILYKNAQRFYRL